MHLSARKREDDQDIRQVKIEDTERRVYVDFCPLCYQKRVQHSLAQKTSSWNLKIIIEATVKATISLRQTWHAAVMETRVATVKTVVKGRKAA